MEPQIDTRPTAPAATSQTSLRNLQIIEVVASAARALTAAEINASLGLPKPTIHRLVVSLETEGFLARDLEGRGFLPGPRLREMMLGVMRSRLSLLPRHAVLVGLAEKVGETCNLAIPDGDAMVYIDRVETQWPLRIDLGIGSRVPLHATASGKMALSQLSDAALESYLARVRMRSYTARTITTAAALRAEIARVRQAGYATDSAELVEGMIAVAVPIRDRKGRFCATLSFHAPSQRLSLQDGLRHLDVLQTAALDLSGVV
ncbi:IclR family transcriptional regulator [Paracoccus suum]|uniref:IclR family transcriptional regulator n=1 Tax=Paracoccus suum TaxID=2259340 RepID=A0A344PGX8_9RHOB|nr:IclR family transcriptional regulator [Paracoccus suum]AXC48633.1 IclR family transcriptional regulator [Paracoccus suum]